MEELQALYREYTNRPYIIILLKNDCDLGGAKIFKT